MYVCVYISGDRGDRVKECRWYGKTAKMRLRNEKGRRNHQFQESHPQVSQRSRRQKKQLPPYSHSFYFT